MRFLAGHWTPCTSDKLYICVLGAWYLCMLYTYFMVANRTVFRACAYAENVQ